MKAGNYKDYADFCRQTDWMDPREAYADEEAAFEREWENFCDAYEEKYGSVDDVDWDIIKAQWDYHIDLYDEHSCDFLLEMSVDEMIKEGFDVKYWYTKYREERHCEFVKNNYDKKYLPISEKDWREQFYNTRLDVMIGFNTKQPWVYDNIRDVYIDPPAEVLDSLPDWREDSGKTCKALLEICKTEPDWLFDRQFWYGDKDFEI